ncbi:hypothetical protein [Enterobacter kobei]|uniref:hypothetical protein n=1 Tax=Enterobacter kobei TaxID=208224 RepID=UPI0032AF8FF6
MQEIYVIAGGDWLTQTLNAIVTFMSTENWVVIRRIATAFSVLVVAISWIRRHNIMDRGNGLHAGYDGGQERDAADRQPGDGAV